MANHASYVVGGLIAVLATDYFHPIVAIDPAPLGAAGVDPAAAVSTQLVERSHKGNRLDRPAPSMLTTHEFQPRAVRVQVFHRPDPRPLPLPVGCDALAGPLAESPLVDLAGRCLTDNSDRQKLATTDHSPGPVFRHLI